MTDSPNVDLVRSIYADWERGDFSSAEWAHPDIVYSRVGGLEEGAATGLAALAKAIGNFMQPWEDWRIEAEEFRELADGRVLVLDRHRGRGKRSGLDVDQLRSRSHTAYLFELRDGKVSRLVGYMDRDDAFADLGLTPEGESP